jgi:hypothetical protein
MSAVRDWTGLTSGMLTVVERAGSDKRGDAMWRCRCSCGNEKTVRGASLRCGESKSCGCARAVQKNIKDMVGQRYSKLTVIERNGSKKRKAAWLCLCDCGNQTTVAGIDLRRGETRSCGCGARQGATLRHGHARHGAVSLTYIAWQAMVKRCEYPRHHNFHNYGGRGVTIDPRWRLGDGKRSGFECFLADMGPRPFGLSLDRVDNDKAYSPENCRWTTRIGQARNRRPRQLAA